MKTKKYDIVYDSIFHQATLQQSKHFEAMSFCSDDYLTIFFQFTIMDLSTICTWQQSQRVANGILECCAAATNVYIDMIITSNGSLYAILPEY